MFMVMEFVDGEPLNRILFREKRRRVAQGVRDRAAGRRGAALHPQAERRPLRHQDREHPDLRGGARGQAHARWSPSCSTSASRARSPRPRASTSLSGTPHYVAPERIRGEPASPSSDVYGVGILLYELITGAGAVGRPGAEDPRRATSTRSPKPPSQLVEGGLDPALETLISTRSRSARPSATRTWPRSSTSCKHRDGHARASAGARGRRPVEARRDRAAHREQRATSSRAIAFDGCRLPLALLTPQGVIVAANPAFAKFVMGVVRRGRGPAGALDAARDTRGRPPSRTSRARSPATRSAGSSRSTSPPGETRRLLLWLDAVSRRSRRPRRPAARAVAARAVGSGLSPTSPAA